MKAIAKSKDIEIEIEYDKAFADIVNEYVCWEAYQIMLYGHIDKRNMLKKKQEMNRRIQELDYNSHQLKFKVIKHGKNSQT